jgi:signal transduction histidine kinase
VGCTRRSCREADWVRRCAAYYVVAEAFTNAAKHARASQLAVMANADDEDLHLLVRDDGIGGADFGKGSGLIGLKDRVEALGGQLVLSSTVEDGTSLTATIPLRGR